MITTTSCIYCLTRIIRRAPQPQHIMAQSAASETMHVQTEAPAQTTKSTNTGHRDTTTPPGDTLFNELPPPNPKLETPVSGPAVPPVTDLTLDFSPSSSIPETPSAPSQMTRRTYG